MTSQQSAGPAGGAVEGGLDDPTDLEPEQGTLALADRDADAHTRADWESAAAAVLRKARRLGEDDADDLVWDRLTRTTLDGIGVRPLGTPQDTGDLVTAGRPTRVGAWDVRAHLRQAGLDAARANETLLVDLEGGVTSLWLEPDPGTDLAVLLDGVLLDLAPVVLDVPAEQALATATAFVEHLDGLAPAAGTNLGAPGDAPGEILVAVARVALEHGVLGVVVDATRVHDRGASEATELGWSVQAGARVLRTLVAAGIALDDAAGLIEFRYAVSDEQLLSLAKLRAARRLWDRALELSGAGPEVRAAGQRQHAVTSRPMMSRYDPHVNIVRATVAAFAAGTGGAEALSVLPFDSPLGRPGVLGRRVARNTSALLISESHVARVTDPVGGSFVVERLTDDLAVAGWAVLGRLDDGADPDDLVAATVAERDAQVATRERAITGLSEFPALGEERLEREPDGAWDHVRPWGRAFEALRDDPPGAGVLLATMGPVAAHTARATFATNLLAAGGIGVDVAGATEDAAGLVAAHAGQQVVCLAGTDAAYDAWGEQAASALREAGAGRVVLAGRAREWADDSCALGVDALAFLTRTREALR